ncbi:MAG TPA: MMPL family transporter [Anaeromyxobacteraceae bacterium]|nr:MMPL family transporter [Anaeromyxobacteraceae bacterium]
MVRGRGAPAWLRRSDAFFALLARQQARRPGAFVAAAVAIAFASGALALRLTLKTGFDQLLPQDRPSVVELHRLSGRIAQGSRISIVLEGDDRAALRRVSGAIVREIEAEKPRWLVEASNGVHPARDFLRPRLALFADEQRLASLRDELEEAWRKSVMAGSGLDLGLESAPPLPSFAEMKSKLLPSGGAIDDVVEKYPDGFFEAAGGRALAVLIRTSIPSGELEASRSALEQVKEAASRVQCRVGRLGVRIGYAGDLVTGLSEYGAVRSDLTGVGLVGVSMVLAIVLLFFMRFRVLVALGATIAMGLALTFGMTKITIGHLNVATAFLISIVAGNGINAGIIYSARYLEARRSGSGAAAAVHLATTATWLPTFGAAVAAAAAYGSLGMTSFLGLKHFALIGGGGMLLCWAVTLAVTPPLLLLAERVRPARSEWKGARRGKTRLLRGGLRLGVPFAALAGHSPVFVTLLGVAITLGGAVLSVRYVSGDRMEYDARRIENDLSGAKELHRLSSLAREALGTNLESSMVVVADRLDQVRPLKAALEAKRDAAVGEKPFETVHSIYDFVAPEQGVKLPLIRDIARILRKAHQRGRISSEEWERLSPILPPAGLAPYGLEDLPDAVARPFSERDGTRGCVLFVEPTAGADEDDVRYLMRWADALRETSLPTGEKIRGAGRPVLLADMLQSIMRDVPVVLGASLLLTILAVMFTFRKGQLSLFVVGSLLAGMAWLVGLLDLFDVKLNFLNFVALPVTFGIGVDYALNVVQRWTSGEGVRSTLVNTGGAVALCSMTTTLSYLALLRSVNRAVRSLGLVAVLGEACCLTAALVFLPAALIWRERSISRPSRTPASPGSR